MKRAATIILFIIIYPFMVKAQCPSNLAQIDVAAGYAFVSSKGITDQFSNTQSTNNATTNNGTPFLTVRYFMYNRLAIGVSGGTTNEQGEYHDVYNAAMYTAYKKDYVTLAVELYYIYSFRKRLELYTLAGLGQTFTTTEATTYSSAGTTGTINTTKEDKVKGQYTPIGARFGGRFGGFLELGIGYKGLINAGLSYKFGNACWWKQ